MVHSCGVVLTPSGSRRSTHCFGAVAKQYTRTNSIMANLPDKRPFRRACAAIAIVACLGGARSRVASAGEADDPRPLSAAQLALFESPHLRNVSQAETLTYQFVREGPGGFTDRLAMHVLRIHPDTTKELSFDFLTGSRRVAYPELDHFRGNPLLLLVLERDSQDMKATLGLSAAYFRNRIREALVEGASVQATDFPLAGRRVPAQLVQVRPFTADSRLEHFPSVRAKTYSFVLCDSVPGTLAEMRIEMPPDAAAGIPAFAQRITFQGVQP